MDMIGRGWIHAPAFHEYRGEMASDCRSVSRPNGPQKQSACRGEEKNHCPRQESDPIMQSSIQ
jgi:hypothetical protein